MSNPHLGLGKGEGDGGSGASEMMAAQAGRVALMPGQVAACKSGGGWKGR